MNDKEAAFLPLGTGLGISLGVVFGVTTDNLALGLSLGVAIGAGLGLALMGAARARKSDKTDADEGGEGD